MFHRDGLTATTAPKTKASQTTVRVVGRPWNSHPPSVLTCTVEMAPACHVAALLGYTGIHSDAISCNWMKVLKHLPKTGRHLRTRRLSFGLTLRDVHMASLRCGTGASRASVRPPSQPIARLRNKEDNSQRLSAIHAVASLQVQTERTLFVVRDSARDKRLTTGRRERGDFLRTGHQPIPAQNNPSR